MLMSLCASVCHLHLPIALSQLYLKAIKEHLTCDHIDPMTGIKTRAMQTSI